MRKLTTELFSVDSSLCRCRACHEHQVKLLVSYCEKMFFLA